MNNELPESPAIYGDFSKLEERVLAAGALGAMAALRAAITGRTVSLALAATGTAFRQATGEFERLRAALDRMGDAVILNLHMPDGSVVDGHARARTGVLTAEDLQRAFPDTPLEGKTIAVEYHAPVARGRRKVGGAQWKNERRGGFSRR